MAGHFRSGGQSGHGSLPASPGDTRIVATGSMRITRGPNHSRKSRKSNQNCTIGHSCCETASDSIRSRERENRNRLAGIPGIVTRPVRPIPECVALSKSGGARSPRMSTSGRAGVRRASSTSRSSRTGVPVCCPRPLPGTGWPSGLSGRNGADLRWRPGGPASTR